MDIIAQENKQVRTVIFGILFFSLVTYAVLYTTLVLFITNGLGLSNTIATGITATFLALHFSLQVYGGFFIGRFISYRTGLILAFTLQMIGFLFLLYNRLNWGIAFFLGGNSFNLVSINSLTTQLYTSNDKTREHAFFYNYLAMNIGAILGTYISGLFEISYNYKMLFLFGIISNIFSLIFLFIKWHLLKDKRTSYVLFSKRKKIVLFFINLLILGFLIYALKWLVIYFLFTNKFIFVIGAISILLIVYFALKEKSHVAQKKIWAFLIFCFFGLIFWSLSLMTPMGLTLFIENNVNRAINGFIIPPQWFIIIISTVIIIFAPLLATFFKKLRKKGYKITITKQFSISLFATGLCFLLLLISIKLADSNGLINYKFIISSYALLGLGEVLLSPIAYAMVGQIISEKFHSLMMGVWFLIIGVGAVCANSFSKYIFKIPTTNNPLVTNPEYFKAFLFLTILALSTAIIISIFSRQINKLTNEN